jgi:DNA-binding IclR family transcriptional regulator
VSQLSVPHPTSFGNMPQGKLCDIAQNSGLPRADLSTMLKPTTEPGVVVHWKADYQPGEKIAHLLASMGAKVSISHQLDTDAPSNLVWIDIGPGSPWK